MATLNYPAWGYALRYRYGIFKQELVDGYQVEVPDYWLDFNPWEFPRHDVVVPIQFYGNVRKSQSVYIFGSGCMLQTDRIEPRTGSPYVFGKEVRL